MATNLSALKLNPLKKSLNPLGAIMEQPKATSTPVPYSPNNPVNDPIQSAIDHGKELQSKIDTHVASQTSSIIPTIDFSSAINGQKAAQQFTQGLKSSAPAPTGGGMMPPTPTATPLPNTPQPTLEQPVQQDSGSFLGDFIPQASANESQELSDAEIKQLIKEGYSDEEIAKANDQLKQPSTSITQSQPTSQHEDILKTLLGDPNDPTDLKIKINKNLPNAVQQLKSQGVTDAQMPEVINGIVNTAMQGYNNPTLGGSETMNSVDRGITAPIQSFVGGLSETNPIKAPLTKVADQFTQGVQQAATNKGGSLRGVSGISTAVQSPFAAADGQLGEVLSAPATIVSKGITEGTKLAGGTEQQGQDIANTLLGAAMFVPGAKKLSEKAPGIPESVSNLGKTTSEALNRAASGDKSISYNAKTGEVIAQKAPVTTSDTNFTKAYDSYKKAIAPSVTETNTPAKAKAHAENVQITGNDIVHNKDSLTYTDKDGNVVDSGRTPQTINEQAQALVQRSDAIYDEYRNLEKEKGLDTTISYEPVIKNLQTLREKIVKNPELQNLIPYIDKKIKTYSELPGNLDTVIEGKKTLNEKLKAYYRNPSHADIGKDAVDAITNKSLGEILDSSIDNSQYGDLKRKWGANKQLQKETFHRDNVTSRQKEFGFFDLTNPLSAMEMIDTLVTHNPLGIAKAAGIQATKWYMKKRNSPNTQIKDFYKTLEGANREGFLQRKLGLPNQSVSLTVPKSIYEGVDSTPTKQATQATAPVTETAPVPKNRLSGLKKPFAGSPSELAKNKKGFINPKAIGEDLLVVKKNNIELEGAMSHRPTKNGVGYNIDSEKSAPDFYTHPEYYDFGGKEYKESIQAIKAMHNKPDAEVTIYRASPYNELRKGDWITLSKEKAKMEQGLEKGSKINSFKVKAKDLHFAGDDITEFGYWGEGIKPVTKTGPKNN